MRELVDVYGVGPVSDHEYGHLFSTGPAWHGAIASTDADILRDFECSLVGADVPEAFWRSYGVSVVGPVFWAAGPQSHVEEFRFTTGGQDRYWYYTSGVVQDGIEVLSPGEPAIPTHRARRLDSFLSGLSAELPTVDRVRVRRRHPGLVAARLRVRREFGIEITPAPQRFGG